MRRIGRPSCLFYSSSTHHNACAAHEHTHTNTHTGWHWQCGQPPHWHWGNLTTRLSRAVVARMHSFTGGLSGLVSAQEESQRLAAEGLRGAEARAREASETLQHVRGAILKFSEARRAEIANDPVFRREFVALSATIGVDPLASSQSAWKSLGLGTWYFELAVRAAGICMRTRERNGGLISLAELTVLLAKVGGNASADDVVTALGKIKVLGDGFDVVHIGGERFVRSVADELSRDGMDVLSLARTRNGGPVTVIDASAVLGWPPARIERAITTLVRDGLAWIDTQTAGGARSPAYYFLAVRGR